MGSTSSKFKKYIQNGDEYAAMQVYQSSPILKKSFDPNLSYGESRHHNTAMHYAARHGMKHLLRTFLTDLGGDPNKRNTLDETVLHSACSGNSYPPAAGHTSISCIRLTGARGAGPAQPASASPAPGAPVALAASAQERRAACVALLLQWRAHTPAKGGEREGVQLDAVDREGNTALHLAASVGLAGSARLLLAAGARSLARDARARTPARRALDNGHARLAALLERAMLFSEEPIDWCTPRWGWSASELGEHDAEGAAEAAGPGSHEGLRPQELREAKDRLLVDTSDMLRVPLFTAEALLRENEWCKDVLVEKWMKDPAACCQAAGVSLPGGSLDSEHPEDGLGAPGELRIIECGICCEEVSASEAGGGPCGHWYCVACWARYLGGRVREGDARPACPAPRCRRAAPPSLLQRCLTPDTQRKYLLFDIKAFVESSRGMKWCPIAGCGRAVRLFEPELSMPPAPAASSEDAEETSTGGYPAVSRGVDCGDFHFFCWDCHGEPHAPLGCSSWARWVSRAGGASAPAPLAAAADGAESAASSLWLLAHCKPCPSCSCPIQKNDGCNHMKCTKCKFDFCWVCLDSWKRHGSATGGYFRCTRDEAAARADQSRGAALAEARVQNVEAQEQWRFAVLCARYRRHEQRWAAERPLLLATPAKVKALDPTGSGGGVLEAAARELALSRRVLAGACAYTFALIPTAPHRAAFHYAQEELERCVSRLSALVAREVVEAPWAAVRRATTPTRRWRLALLRLVRPPPPPPLLSAQELRIMSRLLARGKLDHRDPWRFPLGPRGEPLRVPEPLDPDHTILQEPQLTVSPHTTSERSNSSTDADVYRINVSEYNMDLIIALEMSRLQMLEEQARRGPEPDCSSLPSSRDVTLTRRQRPARLNISVSIGAPADYEDKLSLSDDQLKLAIQLSLQEAGGAPGSSSQLTSQGEGSPQSDGPRTSGLTRQEESWSRAADITVGYFLKALGGAPLDLPNLALGTLDLLAPRQEKLSKDHLQRQVDGNEDDSSCSRHREDHEGAGSSSGTSGFMDYCQDGKSRPPLLRSGGLWQRPPLLRQLGGKVRRSWSMGDISLGSSSTDDTNFTYGKMPDDMINRMDMENLDQNGSDSMPIEVSTLPHPPKTTLKLSHGDNTHYTITKSIQIDAYTQQCDFDYDIVKTTKATNKQDQYRSNVSTESTSKGVKDERKKYPYPNNLPWGEFCCEKKCVKTTPMDNQSPNKYNEKKDRPSPKTIIVLSDAEAPKRVSVDYRGKINPEVFDFNDKIIHLPDLNSSHLKVNTYLTKLVKNRNIGLVSDVTMQSLNQNDIIGDNFRRHSDHIPRIERGQSIVKACSSEKHISNTLTCPVNVSPEKHTSRVESKGNDKATNTESPKKSAKTSTKTKNIPTLSIKICDDTQEQCTKGTEEVIVKSKRGLETDSSNECESETGIPKSPTLYISGVSICRETSPKSTLSTTALTNSDSNVSRSVSQTQYFSRTSSFRISSSEQKSPKVKQKIAWKDYKEITNALPTSPVIVHVTSPSLSPCSETMNTSTYTPGSPELYTPSLLRSTTPTGPRNVCHVMNDLSDENISILDLPVLPPSHFSDDVFMDDDDPGLMIDCSNENIDVDSSLHCPLRGTVYTGCHSGGIMISNMSSIGPSIKDTTESDESKRSSEYICPTSKDDEALYENIFPKNSMNDQLAFEMSLPNSPTGKAAVNGTSNLQKSWSARPLITLNDFTDEALASSKLKSKSANEPERDREMFHFPKSSTDGALSSVLHVQESNLSSDDFHEALFLLERSPKTRDSKRRKRSKKREKDKDKSGDTKKDRDTTTDRKCEVKSDEVMCCSVENLKQEKLDIEETVSPSCCNIENDSPSVEQDEVSSAL